MNEIFIYSLFRKTYGKHADAYVSCLCQFLGTSCDGGTCGDDIVDEQHVLSSYLFAFIQMECISHVLSALPNAQFCLTVLEPMALHHVVVDGYAGEFVYSFSYFLALVVTTVYASEPGDRHGDNGIDVVEESVWLHALDHQPPQVLSNLGCIVVFQVVNQVIGLCSWLIKEQGRHLFYGK